MASLKLKSSTATTRPTTLNSRELGIWNNNLYFGNSSNTPVRLLTEKDRSALEALIENVQSGEGIQEISDQYIYISDLEGGIYKLTYNGNFRIYYGNRYTYMTFTKTSGANLLFVYTSSNYKNWMLLYSANGIIYYGTYTISTSTGTVNHKDLDNIPTITLNGSITTSPTFYAPTVVGRNGQILVSNGSGAPSWEDISLNSGNSNMYLHKIHIFSSNLLDLFELNHTIDELIVDDGSINIYIPVYSNSVDNIIDIDNTLSYTTTEVIDNVLIPLCTSYITTSRDDQNIVLQNLQCDGWYCYNNIIIPTLSILTQDEGNTLSLELKNSPFRIDGTNNWLTIGNYYIREYIQE